CTAAAGSQALFFSESSFYHDCFYDIHKYLLYQSPRYCFIKFADYSQISCFSADTSAYSAYFPPMIKIYLIYIINNNYYPGFCLLR
ncbi:MAG: hypothetical protein IIY53_06410, partial [Solobacterium sp.]|nr:hypothetical protein [Solobacterium sp.]